jgi:hypothetical protein
MQIVFSLLLVAGCYPFYRAWGANKRTTLIYAIAWAFGAWLAWGAALLFGQPHQAGMEPWRFLALSLTGAAGVAVLGARRPQAGAWNLVIVGLMAVMLLPLGENAFLGTPAMDAPRIAFLAATLAVGILNYVPTRVVLPALILSGICAFECLALFSANFDPNPRIMDLAHVSLLIVPWLALAFWHRPSGAGLVIDRLWLDFRDRYGVFWAQRVREQFNRSADNARLPGYLRWHGWEWDAGAGPLTDEQIGAMAVLLKTLLKRFDDE